MFGFGRQRPLLDHAENCVLLFLTPTLADRHHLAHVKPRLEPVIFVLPRLILRALRLVFQGIRLCTVRDRFCAPTGKRVEYRRYITYRFIDIHAHQMVLHVFPFYPALIRLTVRPHHPYITVPILFISHTDGQIVGGVPFEYLCERLRAAYSSTVTFAFFPASSSLAMTWARAASL